MLTRADPGNVFAESVEAVWNGAGCQRFRAAACRREDFLRAGFDCDCAFCCHALTNARLHRWLRWLPRGPAWVSEGSA